MSKGIFWEKIRKISDCSGKGFKKALSRIEGNLVLMPGNEKAELYWLIWNFTIGSIHVQKLRIIYSAAEPVFILHHSQGLFSKLQFGDIFLIFLRKQDLKFHAHCLKCQILFLGKIRKNISLCCLLKILPRVLRSSDPDLYCFRVCITYLKSA